MQIYSFLGDVYKGQDGAPAMAIFKFFQSIFACIAFLYNGHMNLMWQLLILVSMCVCVCMRVCVAAVCGGACVCMQCVCAVCVCMCV